MKRKILAIGIFTLLALTVIITTAVNTTAHRTGPCNDSDGDGSFSGFEYAKHHIVEFARAGLLGNDGHKPGSHQGFSVCNPSEQ